MSKGILSSSIAKKFWMGLTGLFLISFLIVHCAVNAMIFFNDGGLMFNKAAHFMGTNILIRTAEIVLFAGLLIHIIDGLLLYFQNRKARPVKYVKEKSSTSSKWYSRSMALLGTLILLFLIVHLAHFWVKTRITELDTSTPVMMNEGHELENLFSEMVLVFQSPLIVVIYVLGCISLAWHLIHGFKSAFQTFGLNHKRYNGLISMTGIAFSILVSLVFAAMPVSMYLGWIK
ncbi:MAG: succinate dehydrogenase cytochrome b subunit [Flavobacteriales bacterium]|nr:succinate dehydrogenase cytochrome b subunit [Flavobacteriales bacterium]